MRDHPLSLRTRLLLCVGAITLLALIAADFAVYTSLNSYLYGQADQTLEISHIPVEAAANDRDDGNQNGAATGTNPRDSTFCAIGRESAPGMFIEVIGPDHRVVKSDVCPAFEPGERSSSPQLPTVITGYKETSVDRDEPVTYFTAGSKTAGGPGFRVRASKLKSGGVLIVADPINGITNTLNRLLLLELSVTGLALVGSILLGLWLVRVGLRPLREVVKTADSISGGDLMHRVPGANDHTEVGHVALALNVMLERIESSFTDLQSSENRLRQFVSDASHELRTPIAAISAYAQLFRRGADTHAEDLPRVMEGIERESSRMGRLVEDLLLLARFDEHLEMDFQPIELVGLATEAVDTAQMVGPEWLLTLVASDPVEVMGDWSSLRQVVDNLLANVRAHTPPGTAATLRVGTEGSDAVIEVSDQGPGIDADQAATLFERFVRADPSRSRRSGGAGLGLAIVSAIVRAHGGRALAGAGPEGGSVFRVYLPLLEETVEES
jgi:two-component system, OmpR family, sensor kinase